MWDTQQWMLLPRTARVTCLLSTRLCFPIQVLHISLLHPSLSLSLIFIHLPPSSACSLVCLLPTRSLFSLCVCCLHNGERERRHGGEGRIFYLRLQREH